MRWKCVILFLFCSYSGLFVIAFTEDEIRQRLSSFFITRRDTKEAICVSTASTVLFQLSPIFDLDQLKFPPGVTSMEWGCLNDWKSLNYSNEHTLHSHMFIAGDRPFQLMGKLKKEKSINYEFSILASTISLWMAAEESPRGGGLLVELDHWNETTKVKDTTLKNCNRIPEEKDAVCSIVDYKNGTNYLNDGNRWKLMYLYVNDTKLETGGVKLESHEKKWETLIQWSWTKNHAKFSRRLTHCFAKSHLRPAAILRFTHGTFLQKKYSAIYVLKRNYTRSYSGQFCIFVRWNSEHKDLHELLEVKNLVSGQVAPGMNTTETGRHTFFQWNHLDAGEYEFTLQFDKRHPRDIDLCKAGNVLKTWKNYPKEITKCRQQFKVSGFNAFSVGPSSTPDPTIKPNWTAGEWMNVCERLGIVSNDSKQVPIKLCNLYGCNFSTCPHLQDDLFNIFEF